MKKNDFVHRLKVSGVNDLLYGPKTFFTITFLCRFRILWIE